GGVGGPRYIGEGFFLARSFRNLDDLNAQLRHWLGCQPSYACHYAAYRQRRLCRGEAASYTNPLSADSLLLLSARGQSIVGWGSKFLPAARNDSAIDRHERTLTAAANYCW